MTEMTDPDPKPRWYRLTPDRLVIGLLVVECLLWLSERFQWPIWHKGYPVMIAVAMVGLAFLIMLFWFIASLLFRWRFQFSIRSLLVMVVVAAIPCSWLAVEMKKAREQKEAVAAIEKFGAPIQYDFPWGSEPEWLRKLLGDDFFGVVGACIYSTQITDAGLAHLAGLTQLQFLYLDDTQITDAGLANLAGLTRLQHFRLSNTRITDGGLAHIAGLTQLQMLGLDNTKVTDAGLANLAGLTRLQSLSLYDTRITDAGLHTLQG